MAAASDLIRPAPSRRLVAAAHWVAPTGTAQEVAAARAGVALLLKVHALRIRTTHIPLPRNNSVVRCRQRTARISVMRAILPLVLALASASSVSRAAGVRAREDLKSPATIKRLCREHVPGS